MARRLWWPHKRALPHLELAVQLSPRDPWAAPMLNRLGMVHLAMDTHHPSKFEAILGHSHQLLKRYDEAVNHYNASLKCAPKFPIPLVQLAITYTQNGEINEARRAIEKLAEYVPHITADGAGRFFLYKDPNFRKFCLDTCANSAYRNCLAELPGLRPLRRHLPNKFWGANNAAMSGLGCRLNRSTQHRR
jgi:tetratricopeptide (TPR) repeat protein